MYYYYSILHLSSLLLILQYCSLFISFIYHYSLSFSTFYSSFSSHSRFSLVNVLLLFNPLLIILAPDPKIVLPIDYILYQFCIIIFYFYSSFSSQPRFSVVNVLLLFNPSLIIFAPDSPFSLTYFINYNILIAFFPFLY